MAKKKEPARETRSDFLRKALSRNPNLDFEQVNARWAKAGHDGQISNALYYQIRSKLGIHTEWAWVQTSEPESPTAPPSGPSGKAGSKRAKEPKKPGTAEIYQLKITLIGMEPTIWRRIQVEDCTLNMLHYYIQEAMGWTNSHLHQFRIGKTLYADPNLMEESFDELDCKDTTVTSLSDILPRDRKRFRFIYEYDFGDSWEHEILFEGHLPAEPGVRYPRCVEGERACPPEDVGGVWGYAEFLEAIADPKHDQHDELREWVGGRFNPEAFSPAAATKRMTREIPNWQRMR
jgi:hypothetical protein